MRMKKEEGRLNALKDRAGERRKGCCSRMKMINRGSKKLKKRKVGKKRGGEVTFLS